MSGIAHAHKGARVALHTDQTSLPVPIQADDGEAMPGGPMTRSAILRLFSDLGAPVLTGPVGLYTLVDGTWDLALVLNGGNDIDLSQTGWQTLLQPSPHWERAAVAALGGVTGGSVTVELRLEELPR